MQTILKRSEALALACLFLFGMVAPALGRPPMVRMGMGHSGFTPVFPRTIPMMPVRISSVPTATNMTGLRGSLPLGTMRQSVVQTNPLLPAGTIMMQSSGTNFMVVPGTNSFSNTTTLTPTMRFMLLEQAAMNSTLSPQSALSFFGFTPMSSPFGMSPLLPPGLMSLFPAGMNVMLPTPQVNPLLLGVNPLLLSTQFNPSLLSANLNGLTPLGMTMRNPVFVSPTTGLLVSPSMLFLASPGVNSLSLVGLSSLTTGGMTTPATFPFVVALNSDVILTPDEEREFQRKLTLVRSQTGASSTTVWSATDLNVLLDDLKEHPDRAGGQVALSQEVLRHINIVPSKSTGNAGLLKNSRRWPELLQRAAFQDERNQIEALIPELVRQAKAGAVKDADVKSLDQTVIALREKLAGIIQKVPAPQYIRAKRFLVDLQSGVKVLRQPDAGNYFNQMYIPKAKSVRELAQYMAKNDLRFAPATAGDEAAYLVFYQALASYDVSANMQAPAAVSNQMVAAAK
jgi:hypothetical protein